MDNFSQLLYLKKNQMTKIKKIIDDKQRELKKL